MKLLTLATSVLACAFAFADPSDWFGPGYSRVDELAVFDYEEDGETLFSEYVEFSRNSNGTINWGRTITALNAFRVAADAAKTAVEAKQAAANIAEALDVFSKEVVTNIKKTSGGISWTYGGNGSATTGARSDSYTIPKYTVTKNDNNVYSLKKDGVQQGNSWSSSADVDDKSIGKTSNQEKLQVHGWNDASPSALYTLADVMCDDDVGDGKRDHHVLTRSDNGTLRYVRIGRASIPAEIRVDEASIVTNETDDFSASIKGFQEAAIGAVPYAGEYSLQWTDAPTSGAILGGGALPGSVSWLKTSDVGKYYGTTYASAALGWHLLPNVSTNMIMADDVTLKEEIKADSFGNEVKELSWKSTPLNDKAYCVQGDGNGGYLFVDVPVASNVLTAVDGVSVATNSEGQVEICGWESEGTCDADITAMLANDNDENRATHEFLARVDGELHFVPMLSSIGDGESISDDSDLLYVIAPEATAGEYGYARSGDSWVAVPRGGGVSGTNSVDVVTGVEIEVDSTSGKLRFRLTKTRIFAWVVNSSVGEWSDILQPVEKTVVTSSDYSTTTHKLMNSTATIKVFEATDSQTQTEVFTATALPSY